MDLLLNKQVLQIPIPLLAQHLLAVVATEVTLSVVVWRHQHMAPRNLWVVNLLNLTTKVLALNHRELNSNHSVEVQVSEQAPVKSTLLMEALTEAIMVTRWAVAMSAYSPWVVKDLASNLRPRKTTYQTL